MIKKSSIITKDIPLSKLVPTNAKKFAKSELAKVRMSLEVLGMQEYLVVCEIDNAFHISDGNKRYFILLDDGQETAPCIITPHRDIYTASYQVIDVSPTEREKMINKVREKVEEDRIAAAIGVSSLNPGIDKNLADKLHEVVKTAFAGKKLSKAALHELKKVTLKRQAEIMKELKEMKSYKLDMIKVKILHTPPAERIAQEGKDTWTKSDEKRSAMTKQLQTVSEHNALLEHNYHTYVSDVIKMVSYFRSIFFDDSIKKHVMENYPDKYKKIREIMDRE